MRPQARPTDKGSRISIIFPLNTVLQSSFPLLETPDTSILLQPLDTVQGETARSEYSKPSNRAWSRYSRAGRLAGDVVNDSVDSVDLVGDPGGYPTHNLGREDEPGESRGGHKRSA